MPVILSNINDDSLLKQDIRNLLGNSSLKAKEKGNSEYHGNNGDKKSVSIHELFKNKNRLNLLQQVSRKKALTLFPDFLFLIEVPFLEIVTNDIAHRH